MKCRSLETRRRLAFVILGGTLLAAVGAAASAAEPPRAQLPEKQRAFLRDYCVKCHNAAEQHGEVRLDDVAFTIDTVAGADLWQKVLNQVNSGEMPPEDQRQPERAAKTDFLEALSTTLVTARKSLSDVHGRITMRRLNRREYRNTLRTLLGVDIDVRDLPADGGAGNFDTVGSALFMSSDQFEQYLTLGRRALDEAFARNVHAATPQQFQARTEAEEFGNKRMDGLYRRTKEQHANYARWAAAVDAAAARPENLKIAAALREQAKKPRPASGVPYATPLFFYFDWEQIRGAPSPTEFGFKDAQQAFFEENQYVHFFPYYEDYQKLPARNTGAWLLFYQAYRETYAEAEAMWPAGKYVLRMRVAANEAAPPERCFVEIGQRGDDVSAFTVLGSHQVSGTLAEPQIIETTVEVTTDGKREFAVRERRPNSRQAEIRSYHDVFEKTGRGPVPAVWIDWLEIVGPTSSAASPQAYRERREVEAHANRMVGGTYNGYYQGGYKVAKAYLDSDRSRPPSAFGKGIADEQEAKFRVRAFELNGPSFARYLNDPLTQTGAYLTIHNVHPEEVITFPPDQPSGWLKTKHEVDAVPPGEYRLRFRIGTVPGTPPERHFVALGSRKAGAEEFDLLQTIQIDGTIEGPQLVEVPVSLSADGPRTFVLREKRDVKLDNEIFRAAQKATGVGPAPALWIDWVEWEGPLQTRTDSQSSPPPIVTANTTGASEAEHARAILEKFTERAFRDKRPTSAYVDKLTALFAARRRAGDPFETALKEPLSVVLASPGFLYLSEPGDERQPRPLTDSELAVRLSYFLWSAPPDDELLNLARSDRLHLPQELERQVDRLLSDTRADEFVRGFVHQWLDMDRLDFFQFDTKQFRDFDESAKAAARREVYETFANRLRENESLALLLRSDDVFVNGLLATYYGIDGVAGDAFRRVRVPAGSPRGGLLGMAAILAMGSNGERTSPVERGAWVLRKLLNDPPPPAPPNVPQLDRFSDRPLSARERLLAHQEQPQCLQCHRKIDPIGFGLENFNAAGKWRETDVDPKAKREWPIEPQGAFYKGPAFASYVELRDHIAAQPDAFARGFTAALVEYALGRPCGFTDEPLVESVVSRAADKNYALREFMKSLVTSREFQRK